MDVPAFRHSSYYGMFLCRWLRLFLWFLSSNTNLGTPWKQISGGCEVFQHGLFQGYFEHTGILCIEQSWLTSATNVARFRLIVSKVLLWRACSEATIVSIHAVVTPWRLTPVDWSSVFEFAMCRTCVALSPKILFCTPRPSMTKKCELTAKLQIGRD